MIRTKRVVIVAIVSAAAAAMALPIALGSAREAVVSFAWGPSSASISTLAEVQNGCPLIFPDGPVTVAPNQPEVQDRSTVGIINALCGVTLDFIGCGFTPTSITLGCDTNGDGVPDLSIPLKNITVIQRLLVQAAIPSSTSAPGTAFPLACCGGVTAITLSRTVGAGDDNIFGPFTQTLTCSIDLGIRSPVVISATPAEGDCALGQNLLIPGSCFLLADGKPNVTSVFAVEAGNPSNVIQAKPIQILSTNLIDAFFPANASNAGKTFFIFASGPTGTSRNLTALPSGAPAGCTLGNEQGVQVTFKCKPGPAGGGASVPAIETPTILSCRVDRTPSGVLNLTLISGGIREGSTITVGGLTPKKVTLKDPIDSRPGFFGRVILKGRVCQGLPGLIVVVDPGGLPTQPFACNSICSE